MDRKTFHERKTFMKYATMKQDIKTQTDDMRLEIKEESPEFVRAAYKGARGRSSTKFKMYSFRNTENPKDMNKSRSIHTKCQWKCPRYGYDASYVQPSVKYATPVGNQATSVHAAEQNLKNP